MQRYPVTESGGGPSMDGDDRIPGNLAAFFARYFLHLRGVAFMAVAAETSSIRPTTIHATL
jgi:hypothetical protein